MAYDKDLRSLMQSLNQESRSLVARLLSDEEERSKGDLRAGSAEAPIAKHDSDNSVASS
jgi:hypothetical protein